MFKVGDRIRSKGSTEIGVVEEVEDRVSEQWCRVRFTGPLLIWYNADYLEIADHLIDPKTDSLYDEFSEWMGESQNTKTEPKCTCRTLIFGHEDGCSYSDWIKLAGQLNK